MTQLDDAMRKIAAALSTPTPATPPRMDESTEYGRMLAIFSAFDPQQLEKTQGTVQLGLRQSIVTRLKLAGRLSFIFNSDGTLMSFMDFNGASVSLAPDPSRVSGKCDYQTMADILSPYTSPISRVEVRAEPDAAGGPRITLGGRAAFLFTPDGCLRGFVDEAAEKLIDAVKPPVFRPGSGTPPAQPQMQRMPLPERPQPQQQPRQAAIPGPSPAQGDQAAPSAPETPWQQRKPPES